MTVYLSLSLASRQRCPAMKRANSATHTASATQPPNARESRTAASTPISDDATNLMQA